MSSPAPLPAPAADLVPASAPAPESLTRGNQSMDSECNGCRCCGASKQVNDDNKKLKKKNTELRASKQRLIALINRMTDEKIAHSAMLETLLGGVKSKIDSGEIVVCRKGAASAASAAEPRPASVTKGDKKMKKAKDVKPTVLFPCCARLQKTMHLNK